MKKVVSYCLFGNNKKYTIGAIKNAQLVQQYYPGFEAWFYVHRKTVPTAIIDELKTFSHVKIIFKDVDTKPLMWRFEAIDNPEVEIMLCRDTDSRIYLREQLAVNEWLNSKFIFHIMRDHPYHCYKILAGMFGTRKIPGIIWTPLMDKIAQIGSDYDQTFLANEIYPLIMDRVMVHASFHMMENFCKPFPISYDVDGYRFVGEYVDENETRNNIHFKELIPFCQPACVTVASFKKPIESLVDNVKNELETNVIYIAEEHYGSEGKKIIEKILSCAYPEHRLIWKNGKESCLLTRGHGTHDCFNSLTIPYLTYSGEAYLVPLRDYPPVCKLDTVYLKHDPLSYHIPFILARMFHKDYKYPEMRVTNFEDYNNRPFFLAYCFRNPVPYREQLFASLKQKDSTHTSHGLSRCQNTPGMFVNGIWTDLTNTYKNYRFVIAAENCIKPGYLTEKLMNAFISGAIPIYWGDDEVVKDFFNPDAFVNMNNFQNIEDGVNFIIALDQDIERRYKMVSAPIWKNGVIPDLFRIAEDNYFPHIVNEIAIKIKPDIDKYRTIIS
jgi:hypothetical protein